VNEGAHVCVCRGSVRRRAALLLAAAGVAATSAAVFPAPVAVVHATTLSPFAYIGDYQSWTVPAGVTRATFDVFGGQGGMSGGLGGEARATIAVAPGDAIQIAVGGQGAGATSVFPDGGQGIGSSGGGGGSSDIRTGVCAQTN
jgi:hypothetical protein